jgi:hypothetical protein
MKISCLRAVAEDLSPGRLGILTFGGDGFEDLCQLALDFRLYQEVSNGRAGRAASNLSRRQACPAVGR